MDYERRSVGKSLLMVAQRTETWSAPAIPETVSRLRGEVVRFAATANVGDPPLSDVRLAVSEALTNAVLHGYAGRPEPGPVEVTATIGGGALRLVVADEGSGMAPRIDSPCVWLGLPIITSVADTLEVRSHDPHGTELHICFEV